MSSNDDNDVKESDFHKGAGHKIPTFIPILWIVFAIFVFTYGATYVYPNLISWLH